MASYEQAKRLLADHIDKLHDLAGELIKKEVLNADELDQILKGRTVDETQEALQ